jgi:hypothetical protein
MDISEMDCKTGTDSLLLSMAWNLKGYITRQSKLVSLLDCLSVWRSAGIAPPFLTSALDRGEFYITGNLALFS